MRLHLTDIAVRSLKADDGKQVRVWDTTTPGFGILVSPKAKSWVVMYGPSRKLKVLGRYPSVSLKDARVAAFQLSRAPAPPASIALTVQETYDRYFSAYSDLNHKKSTALEARRILAAALLTKHARLPISKVAKAHITDVLDHFVEKPAAANRTFAVLRAFFGWAVRHDYIKSSPCERLRRPACPVIRDRVLSDGELRCIWHATEEPNSFHRIVRLLLLTGQRKSEIAALQAPWIKDNQINFPKELTKNGRQHTFPIGSLSESLVSSSLSTGQELIFPARGRTDSPFNGFSKSKAALDAKLGDSVAPWTLHDLRRTFATNMAKLGVRLEVTEKLLNHVSGSMGGIVSVYQRHTFEPEMRDAVGKWETALKKIVMTK